MDSKTGTGADEFAEAGKRGQKAHQTIANLATSQKSYAIKLLSIYKTSHYGRRRKKSQSKRKT